MFYPPNTPEKSPVNTRRAESPERFTLPPISSTSHIPTPLPSITQQQRTLGSSFYPFASPTTKAANATPPPPPPPAPAAAATGAPNNTSFSYAPAERLMNNITASATAPTYNNHMHTAARTPKQHLHHQQPYPHQDYDYYPKHEWSIVEDNPKQRKKREIDERMKSINQEFLDTKEDLYEEKLKDLQDELLAVKDGKHQYYIECLADLEQQRQKTIHDAKLMMIYQISCVDHEFEMTSKKVHEECMRERQELQNAMYALLNEKRKKLKEEKDGEGEAGSMSTHQTRNRKRMLRKRGDIFDQHHPYLSPSSNTSSNHHGGRKKQDRLKEIPHHLLNALSHRDEDAIEADFKVMTEAITTTSTSHMSSTVSIPFPSRSSNNLFLKFMATPASSQKEQQKQQQGQPATITFEGMAIICFYPNGLFQGHCINTINNESPYSLAGNKLIDYEDPKHNDCMERDDFYKMVIRSNKTVSKTITATSATTTTTTFTIRREANNDASGLFTHEHEAHLNEDRRLRFNTQQFLSGQKALTARNRYFKSSAASSHLFSKCKEDELVVCIGDMEIVM